MRVDVSCDVGMFFSFIIFEDRAQPGNALCTDFLYLTLKSGLKTHFLIDLILQIDLSTLCLSVCAITCRDLPES